MVHFSRHRLKQQGGAEAMISNHHSPLDEQMVMMRGGVLQRPLGVGERGRR